MNASSKYIRKKLQIFDEKGFFGRKISKNALLRDRGYWIPELSDLSAKVIAARSQMAMALGVDVESLSNIHSGSNGRWDCDNYAIYGCASIKAIHDRICRKNGFDCNEYAIWPMSRSDIDHTQALCLTNDGWYIVEFITGQIWPVEAIKPKLLLVG